MFFKWLDTNSSRRKSIVLCMIKSTRVNPTFHHLSSICGTVDGRNPALVYPIIYRALYIRGGAGFQPSTVVQRLGLIYFITTFGWADYWIIGVDASDALFPQKSVEVFLIPLSPTIFSPIIMVPQKMEPIFHFHDFWRNERRNCLKHPEGRFFFSNRTSVFESCWMPRRRWGVWIAWWGF